MEVNVSPETTLCVRGTSDDAGRGETPSRGVETASRAVETPPPAASFDLGCGRVLVSAALFPRGAESTPEDAPPPLPRRFRWDVNSALTGSSAVANSASHWFPRWLVSGGSTSVDSLGVSGRATGPAGSLFRSP